MSYVRNGAYWEILYAMAGWFWQYASLLKGNLAPSDSLAYILIVNTEPGARRMGGKVQPQPTGRRRICRLAIAIIVIFLLALVSS